MAAEQDAQASPEGCPVHHDHRPTADGPAERPAACPAQAPTDAAAAAAGCPAHRTPAEGDAADSSAPETGRPEQGEAQEPQPQEPQPDAEAKPMKCPLGFGSDNTAKLDPLNCVLCRSLYHEAVFTVCWHRFCRFCISPFRDCPLCGADCQPLSDDPEMQETVDKYITVHSRDHKLTAGGKAAPKAQEEAVQHPAAARASFFLQIGLRSFAGGNPAAALARLQACEAALLEQHKEDAGSAALATQLGAVCGSQGDALQRLQQPDRAADSYQQAVAHLQSDAKPSAEAQHALSVCHNKLGDLRFVQGDLPAARDQYAAALDIRRSLCDGNSGDVSPSRQVDLAASLVKVADVNCTLGDVKDAAELSDEARQLVAGLEEDHLDAGAKAKLSGLKEYFAQPQLGS